MTSPLQDIWYLTSGIVTLLFRFAFEYITSPKQISYDDLSEPKVLSELISKPVDKVINNSDSLSFGAGGTGTVRYALQAILKDRTTINLFVKVPTQSLFERIFLTLFRIYDNEFNFYANIRPLLPDISMEANGRLWCPKVHHAKMQGAGKFLLILEDVSKRPEGCAFRTTMDPYSLDRAKAALSQLSKLHAHFWKRPPPGVWAYSSSTGRPLGQTPPFLGVLGDHSLTTVLKRYSHLISFPSDVIRAYELLVANYTTVRKFWSSGPLTLVHGDAHVGSLFCSADGISVGFVDMQCVAAEHCMRDVAYHLVNSCSEDELVQWEEPLLRHYLCCLHANLKGSSHLGALCNAEALTYEEAHFLYRTHAMWALVAWVICCGTNDLVLEHTAVFSLKRVFSACHHLDCLGAIQSVLDKHAQ